MILWIAACFAGFFVKGLCGFANTLVFTSIMGFGAANSAISPVELLVGFPANAIVTWRERKSIRWDRALPLAFLVLAGQIPGVFLLKHGSVPVLKIFCGVVIIATGIDLLLRERTHRMTSPGRAWQITVGLISGILCGMYGVGALLGAVLQRTVRDSHEFKGDLCAVFLFENVFRITLYSISGIITKTALIRSVCLLPAMLAGLFAGAILSDHMPEEKVKKAVIAALIVSGAAMIVMNL